MTEERLSELIGIAAKVAAKLAREYPGVDRDDIQSELTVKVIEQQQLFDDYHNKAVSNILEMQGRKWCGSEISKSSWSMSNLDYSVNEVKEILRDCLTMQTILNTWVEPTSESYRPKHNRRAGDKPMAEWDSIIIGTDVKEHVKYLSEADRIILWRRYIEDDDCFRDDRNMRYRLDAAVQRLTNQLNSFASGKSEWQARHPNGYVGARKVISNEHARLLTSPDYGEVDDDVC